MQWALQRLSQVSIEDTVPGINRQTEATQPVKISSASSAGRNTVPPFTPEVEPPAAAQKTEEISIDNLRPKPEEPKPAKVKPAKKIKPARKKGSSNWLVALVFLFIILGSAIVVWAAMPQWIALARSSSAPIPANALNKPSLTPTPTATFTPTATATFTPTPTSTATNTPIPTSTPWPTNTYQPYPTAVPTQPQPAVNTSDNWIDIDLTHQMLYAYEGGELVGSFLVSTGTSAHPTVTGQYNIYVKYRYTDMTGPGYYLPDVPYTMYFYSGYGIHGTYWHNNFGTPMSHGCVNMRTSDAEWLFSWASVGTLVNIHY
jgi:lipoprotein-anchoring transpeptidase ErfK/SrfK